MASVLIVEDDAVISHGMAEHLALAGFEPTVVDQGETGLARLRYGQPDVCVLDLMLPRIDGWRIIETVRGEGIGTPIIVVSARGTEEDRVRALELGADDYLVKPLGMAELVARVRVAARRGVAGATPARGDALHFEELLIDPRNVQAYIDGVLGRPDSDRVQAAACARPERRPGRHPRRAHAADLGTAPALPRPHGRRVRTEAAGEDRSSRIAAYIHPDPLRGGLQARACVEVALARLRSAAQAFARAGARGLAMRERDDKGPYGDFVVPSKHLVRARPNRLWLVCCLELARQLRQELSEPLLVMCAVHANSRRLR